VNYVKNTTVHSEIITLENIPPIQAAVKRHIWCTYCHANCWNQALLTHPNMQKSSDWGWSKETNGWQSHWTSFLKASPSYNELISCNCKKAGSWTMYMQ